MEENVLDPKDDKLLEEEFGGASDIQRSKRHAKVISWMRRPDYISTEQTRYQPTTMEKVESKIGYVVRKKMGGEQVNNEMLLRKYTCRNVQVLIKDRQYLHFFRVLKLSFPFSTSTWTVRLRSRPSRRHSRT